MEPTVAGISESPPDTSLPTVQTHDMSHAAECNASNVNQKQLSTTYTHQV